MNKRGRRISKEVAQIEGLLDSGLRSPNAAEFVQDGHELQEAIASAVHAGTDPDPEVKAASRKFLITAQESFTAERIGQAVLDSGMSPEETFEAMTRGEFDPFARLSSTQIERRPQSEFVRFVRFFWFPLALVVWLVLYWTVDQFQTALLVILAVAIIICILLLIPGWIRGIPGSTRGVSFLWRTRKRSCPGCGQRVSVLPSEPVCPRCGFDFRTGGAPPQE